MEVLLTTFFQLSIQQLLFSFDLAYLCSQLIIELFHFSIFVFLSPQLFITNEYSCILLQYRIVCLPTLNLHNFYLIFKTID